MNSFLLWFQEQLRLGGRGEAARLARTLDTSKSTVSRWAVGVTPGNEFIPGIARHFGVDEDEVREMVVFDRQLAYDTSPPVLDLVELKAHISRLEARLVALEHRVIRSDLDNVLQLSRERRCPEAEAAHDGDPASIKMGKKVNRPSPEPEPEGP
jgi:hypothetical protein